MLFHSSTFAIFFVVVVALLAVVHGRRRKVMLLIASYVFYGSWNYLYTVLIAVSTVIDFIAAARIDAAKSQAARRGWLAVSVAANLGMLSTFKYAGFFSEVVSSITSLHLSSPGFLLPVGISFYTFQSMSYTIDVYRRRITTTASLLDFSLFVSFFPQLVAGPIVRASELLPQLSGSDRSPSLDHIRDGMRRFGIGFVKKVVIADNLALLVDRVHSAPDAVSSGDLWVCAYAFAFQIFYDFSGYSDMAIGLARMLGFQFPENFLQPYTARNVAEFWRRWHVTLSAWLRDYLYISLGGNRGSIWTTFRNLMLTMALGGLWHGANWTFVVWGLLHGAFLVVHRVFTRLSLKVALLGRLSASRMMTPTWVLLTFHCWVVSMVVFRAESLDSATTMLTRMFSATVWSSVSEWSVLAACVTLLVAQQVERAWGLLARFDEWPYVLRVATIAAAVIAVVTLMPHDASPFIYFQF